MPGTALIILAAGASTRLGRPKQLLPFRSRSLLAHAAQTALASSCRPIAVVLGASAEQIQPALGPLPVRIVLNPDWKSGMGTSIRAGLQAVLEDGPSQAYEAVLLMACDQPLVSAAHLNNLVEGRAESESSIAATDYAGTLGVPAVFHRSLFPALAALPPDAGAKRVILEHLDSVQRVSFPAAAMDVDTLADYQRLMADNVAHAAPEREPQIGEETVLRLPHIIHHPFTD